MTDNAKGIAIAGAQVFDGKSDTLQAATVLLADDRIEAVITGSTIPNGYEVIDATGKYLIPGLIDMHGHFFGRATATMTVQHAGYFPLFVAGGVTTVRTPAEFAPTVTWDLRKRIEVGELFGPRIRSASHYFDRVPSIVDWIPASRSHEEIRRQYARWRGELDFVKVYSNIDLTDLAWLASAAHADGIKVAGHLGRVTAGQAISAGINVLEHGIYTLSEFYEQPGPRIDRNALMGFDPDSPAVTELIGQIVDHDVAVVPTTITFQLQQPEYGERLERLDLWRFLSADAQINHRAKRAAWEEDVEGIRIERILQEKQYAFIERLHKAGGRVFVGTDPSYVLITPGYAIVWEAENLSRSAIPNGAILRALTSAAAKELGIDHLTGSIEAGKSADLVLLAANPLERIGNLASVERVFSRGGEYDPAALRLLATGAIR